MIIRAEYGMGKKSYPAMMWDAIFSAILYLPEETLVKNKWKGYGHVHQHYFGGQ